ncbi:hypothetical protein JKP88DRAFT_245515, partial [Tribonema minus]
MPCTSTLIHKLTTWLHERRSPYAVVRWLEQVHPEALSDDLAHIRSLWRRTYGNSVVKRGDEYKVGMEQAVRRAERMICHAKSDEERVWAEHVKARTGEFDSLSFSSQYELKVNGSLQKSAAHSYTGSVSVDGLLAVLVRQPAFVTELRPPMRQAGSNVAQIPQQISADEKVLTGCDTLQAGAEVHDHEVTQTARCSLPVQTCAAHTSREANCKVGPHMAVQRNEPPSTQVQAQCQAQSVSSNHRGAIPGLHDDTLCSAAQRQSVSCRLSSSSSSMHLPAAAHIDSSTAQQQCCSAYLAAMKVNNSSKDGCMPLNAAVDVDGELPTVVAAVAAPAFT